MKLFTAVAAILCAGAAAFAADSADVKEFTFANDVKVYAIRDKATTMKGTEPSTSAMRSMMMSVVPP